MALDLHYTTEYFVRNDFPQDEITAVTDLYVILQNLFQPSIMLVECSRNMMLTIAALLKQLSLKPALQAAPAQMTADHGRRQRRL